MYLWDKFIFVIKMVVIVNNNIIVKIFFIFFFLAVVLYNGLNGLLFKGIFFGDFFSILFNFLI